MTLLGFWFPSTLELVVIVVILLLLIGGIFLVWMLARSSS